MCVISSEINYTDETIPFIPWLNKTKILLSNFHKLKKPIKGLFEYEILSVWIGGLNNIKHHNRSHSRNRRHLQVYFGLNQLLLSYNFIIKDKQMQIYYIILDFIQAVLYF